MLNVFKKNSIKKLAKIYLTEKSMVEALLKRSEDFEKVQDHILYMNNIFKQQTDKDEILFSTLVKDYLADVFKMAMTEIEADKKLAGALPENSQGMISESPISVPGKPLPKPSSPSTDPADKKLTCGEKTCC
jgi:hypothetical protein